MNLTFLSSTAGDSLTKAIALLNEYLSGARTIGPHEPEFANKPVVTGKPMTSPVTAHSLVLTGVACFLTGWLAARRTYRT